MRILIRIVFVIFIANGIDCLGRICDDCCDCFKNKKEDDKKEEIKGNEKIKEYEEIKDEGNITAKSLVNDAWYDAKEENIVLKIFKKKDNGLSPSENNGDKISINLDENNNPKIEYINGTENKTKLEGEKYALFKIKTKEEKTVYLYCSDVENKKNKGIFEETTHISISVIACDIENVENMSYMFSDCENLKELDIKNFNTTKVTNMVCMFFNCSSLTKLEFKQNFNTSNVTDMGNMFSDCISLENLDISNFNTTKVTDMREMFSGCSRLKNLEIGKNFDTSKVKNKEKMFDNCNNLPPEKINEILGKKK